MTERLEALLVRESNGKSFFTRIGVAFANKDGRGYSVLLEAIPAPVDGQYKIMLREPLPKDGERRGNGGPQTRHNDDLGGDEVPFVTMNSMW